MDTNHESMRGFLLRKSPPVMLALLIQSVYNIADSYFVAKTSLAALTALSIFFPVQLLMTALSTGIGTGIGILIARAAGEGLEENGRTYAGNGLLLSLMHFLLFTGTALCMLRVFYCVSSADPEVREAGMIYGRIVLVGSAGLFIESACTKVLQARGNMLLPMAAQIVGAGLNIMLDPLMIFGVGIFPEMGVRGAALATIIGQWAAMTVVLVPLLRERYMALKLRRRSIMEIYRSSVPSILMQSLYTVYIIGLNLILKQFGDEAVTVLGIYYKLQTFFFIPLMGLQQSLLPLISFCHGRNNAAGKAEALKTAIILSETTMFTGMIIFMLFPGRMMTLFSADSTMTVIGRYALRVISISFLPAGLTMMLTIYFQGTDNGKLSIIVTMLRQVILLVPVAWVLSHISMNAVWWTFPIAELITAVCSVALMLMTGRFCSI